MSQLRDWPIAGVMIAGWIVAVIVIVAWMRQPAPPAVAAARPVPPPAPPAITIDRDKAFAEFHARQLGLPAVWTYSTKAAK